MDISNRSGNCGEMAALSAYYALKINFTRRDLLFVGCLGGKGDHAFCLVAQESIASSVIKYASLAEFISLKAAKSWLMIDPWLNTACYANDYLTQSGNKLEKWAADGKRVSWHGGSQGPGWYVPNGEYKTEFGKATLSMYPF